MKTNTTLRYEDGILWLVAPAGEEEICRVGSVFNNGVVASEPYLSSLEGKNVLLVQYSDACWVSDVTSASKFGEHRIVGDKPLIVIDNEKSYIIKELMDKEKDAEEEAQ